MSFKDFFIDWWEFTLETCANILKIIWGAFLGISALVILALIVSVIAYFLS